MVKKAAKMDIVDKGEDACPHFLNFPMEIFLTCCKNAKKMVS